jgi:hypothetical protein
MAQIDDAWDDLSIIAFQGQRHQESYCVMEAHRTALPTAQQLCEAIVLQFSTSRPVYKVRHSKSPPRLPVVWITWLFHRYASNFFFFFTQFRHISCYSHYYQIRNVYTMHYEHDTVY